MGLLEGEIKAVPIISCPSLLQYRVDLPEDLPRLERLLPGEFLDGEPHVDEDEVPDLHVHEVELDLLPEVPVVDHPDVVPLQLNDLGRNRDAHASLPSLSPKSAGEEI